MVHAENGFAIDHLVKKSLAAGDTDPIYHALTRPEEFEAEATGRAIRLAEYADAPIYIVHVSCKRAVDEVIAARARGVRAYGETCIQYLFASIDDLRRPDFEGARYVCSPPLRDAANQPHMWDALNFDHLQSISTDHCPFTDEQKRLGFGDFSKIPNGLAAIQHRLPLLWEHGVKTGRHDAQPLRRGDLDGDREDLRPLPEQGHDRARRRRRHRDLRPRRASTSSRRPRRS